MTQQINLYDPALRQRQITLTAARVAICCAVTVVWIVGLWFYEQQVVVGLKGELASAQNLLKAQREHVERVSTTRQARAKDTTLEAEINRLEAEINVTRAQLEMLKGGASGETQGFSEYLRAFSRQSVDGLWLTGVDILAGGEITIRGRTLNPALVPDYIQRLDREEALRGRSFGALEIARPAPAAVSPSGQKGEQELPRFLEFSLATAEPVSGPGAGPAGRTP
ncbi:MAG: PilN domain-containing protein [Betaproteobacteria bacterium]|nr:PilN domain-containing protein [Betaproteobacteria bacterium]